jgi:hypothetical protein
VAAVVPAVRTAASAIGFAAPEIQFLDSASSAEVIDAEIVGLEGSASSIPEIVFID